MTPISIGVLTVLGATLLAGAPAQAAHCSTTVHNCTSYPTASYKLHVDDYNGNDLFHAITYSDGSVNQNDSKTFSCGQSKCDIRMFLNFEGHTQIV